MFDDLTIENIQYYVYILKDPRDGNIFYVGKGHWNRVFQHLQDALENPIKGDKLDKIRDIVNSWNEIEYYIVRHWIWEEIAFEVESSFIDFLGLDKLTNSVLGSHSHSKGMMSINEIKQLYWGKKIDIVDQVMLININRLFRRNMTEEDLYQATRKSWKVWNTKDKVKYVLVHYKGIVRDVYEVIKRDKVSDTRWAFEGKVANEEIREKYINGLVKHYFPKWASNPIRYINC